MNVMRGAWTAGLLVLAGAGCADDDAGVEDKTLNTDNTDGGTRSEDWKASATQDASEPTATANSIETAKSSAREMREMKDAGAADDKRDQDQAEATPASPPSAARDPRDQNKAEETAPKDSKEMQASSDMTTQTHVNTDADADAGAGPVIPPASTGQATLVGLGELLFEDKSLSLTRTQACASCHDQASAFSGNADHDRPHFPVSRGDIAGRFGTRNAPTAMYMQFSPPFSFEQDPDDPSAYTPTGGLFWDGRVNSLSEQAAGPFLNPREMALPDKQAVIDRVRQASYVWMFEPLFGPAPLADVDMAYQHVTDAIAAYERTDRFNPFSSKFDAFLRGQVRLSAQEQLGFDLYKDPEKGNCISCHVGDPMSTDPHSWLFTDFTYDNLGIPRNLEIPDNADPSYYDLGLCRSEAVMQYIPEVIEDKAAFLASFCGAFKVPTLRNVAETAPYGHNGFFQELRDVVDFYVTRETDPGRWYPQAQDGRVRKYDDLPQEYTGNVNTSEVPYDRKAGEEPRLTPDEIDAVVAFLRTLSDGYHVELHDQTHGN